MEYDDGSDPKCAIRLAAYERAGYLKANPAIIHYHQPDFRPPAEIDATGGPHPLPYQLVLRQIGRESERTLRGDRLRRLVRALYTMYAAQLRAEDMAHPSLQLDLYPDAHTDISLLPPTAR
jgi:hypothetical protein